MSETKKGTDSVRDSIERSALYHAEEGETIRAIVQTEYEATAYRGYDDLIRYVVKRDGKEIGSVSPGQLYQYSNKWYREGENPFSLKDALERAQEEPKKTPAKKAPAKKEEEPK